MMKRNAIQTVVPRSEPLEHGDADVAVQRLADGCRDDTL